MYSIIIGLGVSRLLEGVKNLVVAARPWRGSLLYIGMLVIGLLVHATTWLSLWTLRDVEAWKVWSFLQLMLAPIALYLYSAIAVPDHDRSLDLGEYYLDNASRMHGLLIAAIFFNSLTEFMLLGFVYSPPAVPHAARADRAAAGLRDVAARGAPAPDRRARGDRGDPAAGPPRAFPDRIDPGIQAPGRGAWHPVRHVRANHGPCAGLLRITFCTTGQREVAAWMSSSPPYMRSTEVESLSGNSQEVAVFGLAPVSCPGVS